MKPHHPLTTWPLHFKDWRFGLAWYTAPGVFVNQIHQSHGSVAVANALHDAIDHVLFHHAEDLKKHGGLMVIHDWRKMTSYDSEAREAYLERMRARPSGYLRKAVAVIPSTPLLRMAVQTANIVMAMRSGGTLQFATDLAAVLEQYEVRHPTPNDWR
jgi:hypothetical protein